MWEEINEKYSMDRHSMSEEMEKEFVNDCFEAYEQEGFSKKFWCQSSDYSGLSGKPFKVIRRATMQEVDLESLPMWMIEFEDGTNICSFPDEIIPREMRNNGCKLDGID